MLMDSVKLDYSLQTEAKSLIHTVFGVSNGFYIKNGWNVLPYKVPYSDNNSNVYLPELNYINIFGSYIKVSETDRVLNMSESAQCKQTWVKAVSKALHTNNLFAPLTENKTKQLQKEYIELLLPAVKKIKKTISIYKNKTFKITVIPTQFGVGLSFSILRKDKLTSKTLDIDIKIRNDAPSCLLLEGLASSISRGLYEQDVKNVGWRETESISDFITKYLLDCKDYTPTLAKISNKNIKVLEESLTT